MLKHFFYATLNSNLMLTFRPALAVSVIGIYKMKDLIILGQLVDAESLLPLSSIVYDEQVGQ